MDNQTVKILLIEDNVSVAQVIAAMLKRAKGSNFDVVCAETLQGGLQFLIAGGIDAIFLDLTLPDSHGLETIEKVQAQASSVPIIVLTGVDDEELATQAVRSGAQDYIVKGQVDMSVLARAVRYAIERKHTEDALRRTRDELEIRVLERTAELRETNELLSKEVEERKRAEQDLRVAHTKLQEAQAQLIQAAKMQVVGGLASGVAHEVKNPLAIILQGVEYLEKKVPRDNENVVLTLGYIRNAVERADGIVRGLMDFASISQLNISKQPLKPVLEKALVLMKHQCDKQHITVRNDLPGDIPDVSIDRNRIEQVLLNLLMNAADAMPQGGTLTARTFAEYGDNAERLLNHKDSGEKKTRMCVVLEIEDTGTGIPPNVLDRIFDPFFTTKRTQGGTGLGLAIVKNILEMHGAQITITIKNEGGTRVRVVFPA